MTTPEFKSEADLCTAFIEWARPQGWTAYAETAGWDIVLVDTSGVQIGVQAKLHFNATLIRQVLPSRAEAYAWNLIPGPDYRAVLLPKQRPDFHEAAEAMGVIAYFNFGDAVNPLFAPDLNISHRPYVNWSTPLRLQLPDYVPDIRAGASGPVQLTTWKVRALRLIALIDINGFVTRKDFADIGLDHRRWTNPLSEWLKLIPGTPGHYVRGKNLKFDRQHPDVFTRILAEAKSAEAKRKEIS